jgi:hypothetical protein
LGLVDTTFDPQHYATVLPDNSPLRKPLGVAVRKAVQDDWWGQPRFVI